MLDDSSGADCTAYGNKFNIINARSWCILTEKTIDTKGRLGQKALNKLRREQNLLYSVAGRVASMAAGLIWAVCDMRREGDFTCSGTRGQYKEVEEVSHQLGASHTVNE